MRTCLGTCLSLLVNLATAAGAAPPPSPVTLVYNGWTQGALGAEHLGVQPQLARLYRSLRVQDPDLLLVSTGNVLGPSVTSDQDGGRLVIELMNDNAHDVMGLGPHELFAGEENLLARLAEADFPVVATNLRPSHEDEARRRAWEAVVRPHVTLDQGARRVAVFSLLSPRVPDEWPSWNPELGVEDPEDALLPHRERAEAADLTLVLSSMTVQENLELLRRLPWVDLVVGQQISLRSGFDYGTFEKRLFDGRRIVSTRCYGVAPGRIEAARGGPGLVAEVTPLPVSVEDPGAPAVARRIRGLEARTRKATGTVLTHLTEAEREDFATTTLRALRHELKSEVGLIHRSAFPAQLPPEDLRLSDLRRQFPFPDQVARFTLEGKKLAELWKVRDEALDHGQGLVLVGMSEYKGRLLVNGRPLDEDEAYRVATVEYLARGGLGLVEPRPDTILDRSFFRLLASHFGKHDAPERKRLDSAARRRPVYRRKTEIDFSFDQLAFGGAASRYQFKAPGQTFTSSDIPGLVGFEHVFANYSLRHEQVIDRPESDLTLRLSFQVSRFRSLTTQDRAQVVVRHEKKGLDRKPRNFAELNLTGAVTDPEIAGVDQPLFAKFTWGKAFQLGKDSRLFAGPAWIQRFSQPGSPGSPGLSVQHEFEREVRPDVTVENRLDVFASADSDQIRTLDWRFQLRFKVWKNLSTVIRRNLFMWRDGVVQDTASREEFYFGVGLDLARRWY